ncbi:MAG: poly-beta-hydroxybutyrate-responsive repressor [Chloroflexi bacterium]|nr:poly-beta-hydroxybutyrate-responsive repressor [Chloroflexota bacterium]
MSSSQESVVGMPRDFLAACLLLLLRQWSMHGYRLMQQLVVLGFAALDPGTVYRTLRQLERDGLIRSHWDLGDAGPARRMYELTEAGEAFLRAWAQGLEHYRRMLDLFFRFYGIEMPSAEGDGAGPRRASGAQESASERGAASSGAKGEQAGGRRRGRTSAGGRASGESEA